MAKEFGTTVDEKRENKLVKWEWLHLEVDAQVLLAAHRVSLDEVADKGHAIVDEDLDDWHQQRDGVDDVDGHLLLATIRHDTNVGQ